VYRIVKIAALVIAASALVLSAPSLRAAKAAATGNRPGCLIVTNQSGADLTLHVRNSSDDGEWDVPNAKAGVLSDNGVHIVVDENTEVWATSDTTSFPRLALLANPKAAYHADAGRSDCKNGAVWDLALSAGPATNAPPASAPASGPFTIAAGVGIGPVRLGMNVRRDVVPLLGAWKQSSTDEDGAVYYGFFTVSKDANGVNHGGGISMWEANGAVSEISVYHDPRYAINGIHTGSTEAQLRTSLGEPMRVTNPPSADPTHNPVNLLWYKGVLFRIGQTPTDPDGDYQKVFEITVVHP